MITIAILLSILISNLPSYTPFMVEGPSMLPTLHDGEMFILDEGIYKQSEPERGEIVIFYDDKKPDYFYIKRVMGLPGERIHVTSKGIYLEEKGVLQELIEPYLAHAEDNKNYSLKGYKDQIFVVPEGKYFVLGDNRQHSLDSRSFIYPFIPKERIKGKYLFTLLN
jgi:signal peptidase I